MYVKIKIEIATKNDAVITKLMCNSDNIGENGVEFVGRFSI
jgi:hypothetical protein